MALEIIKILQEEGHDIHLYTVDKTDWEYIKEKWGKYPIPKKEYYKKNKKLNPENILDWLQTVSIYIYYLIKTYLNYPITINNYGEACPYLSEITFFHAEPLFKQKNNPYNIPFWNTIEPLYEKVTKELNKRYCTGKFVTNSHYNAEIITLRYNKPSIIIHPFIKPIPYYYSSNKTGEILIISRITPKKNIPSLIYYFSVLPKEDFTLMGQTTQHSGKIQELFKNYKNINIIRNPKREDYENTIKTSSIIFSTQPNEAFGISLLEAMSAGCIPIVPKDGGPWYDILEKKEGIVGYGYDSLEEAVEKMKLVLTDAQTREKLRENSIIRSRDFNESIFKEDIVQLIKETEDMVNTKLPFFYKYHKIRDSFSESYLYYTEGAKKTYHKIQNYINNIFKNSSVEKQIS